MTFVVSNRQLTGIVIGDAVKAVMEEQRQTIFTSSPVIPGEIA